MSDQSNDPNKGKRRSSDWWGKADKDGFAHRSWMKNQGLPEDLFDGRPVIGIANTFSEFTPPIPVTWSAPPSQATTESNTLGV